MKTSSASNIKTKEKMDSGEYKNCSIIMPEQKDFEAENWSYDLMSENSSANKIYDSLMFLNKLAIDKGHLTSFQRSTNWFAYYLFE